MCYLNHFDLLFLHFFGGHSCTRFRMGLDKFGPDFGICFSEEQNWANGTKLENEPG